MSVFYCNIVLNLYSKVMYICIRRPLNVSCCCFSPRLRSPSDRSPQTASGCRQGVRPLLQQLRHCHGFVPEIQGFQMGFDVNAREEVFGVVYVCLAERAEG